jgi:glycosyltransferase involved in cell wall biosynthesis
MSAGGPLISVLICTCDPNPYTLDWVLDALLQQTLPAAEFEIVLVDNNSRTPLQAEALRKGRPLPLKVLREPRPGKPFALCMAIREARAPLLLTVDDDNGLAANYLAEAVRIAREEPGIGAFSGSTKLLTDLRIPGWKVGLLPYLGVRDHGPEVITSSQTHWGQWEPIGAGMVFRRDVGLRFIECIETNAEARQLIRCGKTYIGGEDQLMARAAYWAGYSCSYQPTLWLSHFIKGSRMTARQLARSIQGSARGWVINERICGRPPADLSWFRVAIELMARLRFRVKEKGFREGAVLWFWDIGEFQQIHASAHKSASATNQIASSKGAGG